MQPITGVIRAGFGGESIRQAIERANAKEARQLEPPLSYPTYDHDRIKSLAGEPDSVGTRIAVIDARKGETVWNPASTKRLLYGPITLRFEFHVAGVNATIISGTGV